MSRREGGQMQRNALLLRPPTDLLPCGVAHSPQGFNCLFVPHETREERTLPILKHPTANNLMSSLTFLGGGFPESLNQGGSRSCSQSPISGTFGFSICLVALSLRQRGLCFLNSNQVVTLKPFYYFFKAQNQVYHKQEFGLAIVAAVLLEFS